jgi:hypothetical protein
MVVKPWETKRGIRAAAYPIITTKKSLAEYCKRKRVRFTVIFKGSILPHKCAHCGKTIKKDDANLVDVLPKAKKYAARHYYCAWESLLANILKIGEDIGMI